MELAIVLISQLGRLSLALLSCACAAKVFRFASGLGRPHRCQCARLEPSSRKCTVWSSREFDTSQVILGTFGALALIYLELRKASRNHLYWQTAMTRRPGFWSLAASRPRSVPNRRGQHNPETFDFLRFTHFCGTKRASGRVIFKQLTVSKRMRATLMVLRQTLYRRRRNPLPVIWNWLRRVAQGYFHYYAVPGNTDRPSAFRREVEQAWLHVLHGRGQHGRMQWIELRRYVALAVASP